MGPIQGSLTLSPSKTLACLSWWKRPRRTGDQQRLPRLRGRCNADDLPALPHFRLLSRTQAQVSGKPCIAGLHAQSPIFCQTNHHLQNSVLILVDVFQYIIYDVFQVLFNVFYVLFDSSHLNRFLQGHDHIADW